MDLCFYLNECTPGFPSDYMIMLSQLTQMVRVRVPLGASVMEVAMYTDLFKHWKRHSVAHVCMLRHVRLWATM